MQCLLTVNIKEEGGATVLPNSIAAHKEEVNDGLKMVLRVTSEVQKQICHGVKVQVATAVLLHVMHSQNEEWFPPQDI